MGIIKFLADLFGSQTLALCIRLIPLLGRAYDTNKGDEWIFEHVKKFTPNATLEEMKELIHAGKEFTKACYHFLHK